MKIWKDYKKGNYELDRNLSSPDYAGERFSARQAICSVMINKKLVLTALGLILLCSGAAPMRAQQTGVVPIVEMRTHGLLGGVENGKWIAAKRVAPLLKNKTEYVLLGANGVAGERLIGEKPQTLEICEDYFEIPFGGETKNGVGIGLNAKWNLMPRAVKEISKTDATYLKIVGDFARSKGIAKPIAKISQGFRVDLDGDGSEEVLLAATNYKSGIMARTYSGDYSFLLLRKIVGGKAQNILIGGEFYPKPSEFAAPNEYSIQAIADLNGDGRMEFVMHAAYYEGAGSEVYDVSGAKPKKVLETGCGV